MIKINLLSEGKRPTAVRKAKPAAALLESKAIGQYLIVVGVILGLAASGVYWWKLHGQVQEQQEAIATAQAEVDALGAVIKEVEAYKAKKAELERKIGLINDLKANQKGPVRVMDYVSRSLPELLWLDRMTMNASTISIEGRAFNTNAVATFIEKLDDVPEFDEPILRDTSELPGNIYKFVIDFNYSFAVPKPKPAEPGAPAPAPAPTPGAPAAASR